MRAKKNQPFDPEAFLSSADGGRTISLYGKGEIVFRQGDPANEVFYILSGECKVTVVSEQGKEAVVAIPGKGDFFGEGCLNGQGRRLATVTAITGSRSLASIRYAASTSFVTAGLPPNSRS